MCLHLCVCSVMSVRFWLCVMIAASDNTRHGSFILQGKVVALIRSGGLSVYPKELQRLCTSSRYKNNRPSYQVTPSCRWRADEVSDLRCPNILADNHNARVCDLSLLYRHVTCEVNRPIYTQKLPLLFCLI